MNRYFSRQNSSLFYRSGLSVLLLLGLSFLAGCDLFREQAVVATATPAILQVSADQAAKAMQEDHFFSDYNPYILQVQGIVAALTPQGSGTRLELKTSLATVVLCDSQSLPAGLQPGSMVTISAQASQAQRAPGAVLFKNCEISK